MSSSRDNFEESDSDIDGVIAEVISAFRKDEVREEAEKITDLRSGVIAKMNNIGLTANNCWMLFRTFVNPPSGYYLLPDNIPVDTLIIKYFANDIADKCKPPVPTVRIFRTEHILVDGGTEHIVQDVIVDADSDTQYLVDLIFQSGDNELGGEEREHAIKERLGRDVKPVLSLPVFEEGRLYFTHHYLSSFTSQYSLGLDVVGDTSRTRPFGHYSNPVDKRYSLGKALELFRGVESLEPDESGELTQDHTG